MITQDSIVQETFNSGEPDTTVKKKETILCLGIIPQARLNSLLSPSILVYFKQQTYH